MYHQLEKYSRELENRRNLKKKKRMLQKVKMDNAIDAVRIGLTSHPEINFECVPVIPQDDLVAKSRYDQSIYNDQAILFGMDILSLQKKKFQIYLKSQEE